MSQQPLVCTLPHGQYLDLSGCQYVSYFASHTAQLSVFILQGTTNFPHSFTVSLFDNTATLFNLLLRDLLVSLCLLAACCQNLLPCSTALPQPRDLPATHTWDCLCCSAVYSGQHNYILFLQPCPPHLLHFPLQKYTCCYSTISNK